MTDINVSEILDEILEKELLGKDFVFRKGQRETVESICNEYIKDPNVSIIIDAPTGSGKSMIAIASSLVLTKMDKTGYILASDLSLQDQYENDLRRLNTGWFSMKGADNYICDINAAPFSIGDCRLRGMGYEQAKSLPCYRTCSFFTNRDGAITSKVSLLNYSFWLLQRNYVDRKENGSKFEKRDFVFFDEAHKIDEIVQNHFSPKMDESIFFTVRSLTKFLETKSILEFKNPNRSIELIFDLLITNNPKEKSFEYIKDTEKFFRAYTAVAEVVKTKAKKLFKGKPISKEWRGAFVSLDKMKDIHCKFEDFVEIINEVGVNKLVQESSNTEVKFSCIEERFLIKKYLHAQAGAKIFMSATIGDPKSYMKIMGIDNAKIIILNNDFNYDKSPIIYIDKYKMSYNEKAKSLPPVLLLVDRIINKHKDHRGIIHTGSYEFTNKIIQHSTNSKRLFVYNDSKSKAIALMNFKESKNGILIGPSILEGLDLKDDISRFQIIFKMPYPSLASPFVKEKINYTPEWYDWKTSLSLLQGIGRSVRSADDWAITYILDGCFTALLNKNGVIPTAIKNRIKILKNG